jgi:hypothetical protein
VISIVWSYLTYFIVLFRSFTGFWLKFLVLLVPFVSSRTFEIDSVQPCLLLYSATCFGMAIPSSGVVIKFAYSIASAHYCQCILVTMKVKVDMKIKLLVYSHNIK